MGKIAEEMVNALRGMANERWSRVYEHDQFFRAVADQLERLNTHPKESLPMKPNILDSAVECLRQIAALSRRQASDLAKNWLATHGYAREEGGYVAGKGFEAEVIPAPGILCTTRYYPCGCRAYGPGDVPPYCPNHGYSQSATIDTGSKSSSLPQGILTTGLTD